MMYESHKHTPLCKHAYGEPEEYAARAEERGLRGIIVTCHNPMPDGFSPHVRMSPAEFDEYLEIVNRARDAWSEKRNSLKPPAVEPPGEWRRMSHH